MTSAQRQTRFRRKLAELGYVQVNVWVPASAAPGFKRAAELASENPDLEIGRMVDTRTGKLRGMK